MRGRAEEESSCSSGGSERVAVVRYFRKNIDILTILSYTFKVKIWAVLA
jgi:hypothetical protein